MELTLRKLGNSTGLTFPPALLRDLHFTVGQPLLVETDADGGLTLRPKRARPRYTAAELNALCDLNAPMPQDLQD